jgi:xanthosine utilization system XapX-like protein
MLDLIKLGTEAAVGVIIGYVSGYAPLPSALVGILTLEIGSQVMEMLDSKKMATYADANQWSD